MTWPNTQTGRRQFLSAGTPLAVTAALDGSAPCAGARQDRDRPWIPSNDFPADLPRLMEVVSLPGLAMATVEGGKVVWTRAVGVTNAETRAPMRDDSVCEAASLNVAGMLSTTVAEYARFMTLIMDRPRRAPWEITETSRRAMLRHQTTRKANALYWGLGWGLEEGLSGLLFYHSGLNSGCFATFCVGDPVRRRAIAIFTNGGGGQALYQPIVRAALGYDMLEFMRWK